MIAIYCSSEPGGRLLARCLKRRTLITNRWAVFVESSLAAEAAVIGYVSEECGYFQQLSRFRLLRGSLPTVLITNSWYPNSVDIEKTEAVVHWAQVETLLQDALESAISHLPRRRIANEIRALPGIPRELCQALTLICEASEPIRTVTDLAYQTGYARTKLARLWKGTAMGRAAVLRLEDVVDWLLLLRALRTKTPHESWRRVGEALGVADYTLGRLARRLVNCTLLQLEREGHQNAVALFRHALMQQLAGM
ncbi:MAG TPA: hypothetical protein VFK39_12930 [Gemmatimonadaceae bacterium]|nr:hypothetical protein [Gemmatimonadaceae bacterium]